MLSSLTALVSLFFVMVVMTAMKHFTTLHLPPTKTKRRQLQKKPAIKTTTATQITENGHDEMRFLYIITSSSISKGSDGGTGRWTRMISLVILDTVHNLLKVGSSVDVYLILSYTLPDVLEQELRKALPPSVGLEIWNDASPMKYWCEKWNKDGRPAKCWNFKKKAVPFEQAKLRAANAQLARQHRFVLKDKLAYYDLFVAFEDDMYITDFHVNQHLKWSRIFEQQFQISTTPDDKDWRLPLGPKYLERLRPGFIRVEVLGDGVPSQPQLDIAVNQTDLQGFSTECCQTNLLPNKLNIKPEDIVIWETGILGLTVRPLLYGNTTEWVAILPGAGDTRAPGYFPGNLVNPPLPKPNELSSKFLAQSAGMMATPTEIIKLHTQMCLAGFLPPFDQFLQDGLQNHNVEFYSGGLQISCNQCRMARVIPLKDFGKHLLYHTSNNKHTSKDLNRMVLAHNLLAQLWRAQAQAQKELDEFIFNEKI